MNARFQSLKAWYTFTLLFCLTLLSNVSFGQDYSYSNPTGKVGESTNIVCDYTFSPRLSVTMTYSSDKLKAAPGLQIDVSESSFCSDGNVDVSVTVSPDGSFFTVTITRTDNKPLPNNGTLFRTSGGGGGSHIIMLPLI